MVQETFSGRNIISIGDISRSDLTHIISVARQMQELERSGRRYSYEGSLKGKRLASLFYEPSTRTRTSFETAMQELGGSTFGFVGTEGTSVRKNESILATVMMYWANHADALVMRHPSDGAVQWTADILDIPVINGGDGKNEHPTQALLDLVTIDEINPGIDGTRIGFGGDLANGRTVRSNALALSRFDNITISWAASDEFGMPKDLEAILRERGVEVRRFDSVQEVMRNSDVYYMTRPQKERIKDKTPEEINHILEKYRIDLAKIASNPDIRIMHPLPVDSITAEIDVEVFFSNNQYFLRQAENGIFLRKALLYEILKDTGYTRFCPQMDHSLNDHSNRENLPIRNETKSDLFIDRIRYGTVIDHIRSGTAYNIDKSLGFSQKGYRIITSTNDTSRSMGRKDLIKITDKILSERELKEIAEIDPDVTFNFIEDGKVIEKFRYDLCRNENCVTRDIKEDVPPRFDISGSRRFCHYCRREY